MMPDPDRIGFVTGLAAEARLLRGVRRVGIGGGLPAGARAAAERLVAQGAQALVSFGLAGGLDPSLTPGTIVIPAEIVVETVHFATDATLGGFFGGITHGAIVQTDAVLATVAEKAAVFAATGAVAVDLESGAVAQVARLYGLPFTALRAVCDPAGRDLPPAALAALDNAGAIGLLRVLGSLLAQPGQIGALIVLARDAAAARRSLVARLRARPLQRGRTLL